MNDFVSHYTKMSTLEKIFLPKESKEYKDGKIRLRLTNIRFLNDPSEGLVLADFFKKNREEIANCLPKDIPEQLREIIRKEPITDDMLNLDNIYTFSASSAHDSFVFWNKEYAGLDGVAIVFENEDYTYNDDDEMEDILFQKVNYIDSSTKEELINSIAGGYNSSKFILRQNSPCFIKFPR